MEQYFTDLDGLIEQAAEIAYFKELNKTEMSKATKYVAEQAPKILRKYDINFINGMRLIQDVLELFEEARKIQLEDTLNDIGDETAC